MMINAQAIEYTYTVKNGIIEKHPINETRTGEEPTIKITAELEEDDNQFTEDDYDVRDFVMTLPSANLICPTNNCSYELENGEFRKNTFNGFWMLQGELKVGQQQEGGTENSIFDLRADLNRISSFESNDGVVTERLFGGLEIRLPGTTIPLGSYSISNSTVTFGDDPIMLTL